MGGQFGWESRFKKRQGRVAPVLRRTVHFGLEPGCGSGEERVKLCQAPAPTCGDGMDRNTRMAQITVRDLMTESGVAFGTSGARGTVIAMTDRVCYGYTRGFLSYLAGIGEFPAGGRVALAGDLRPSTPRILAACARAVRDSGGIPVFCGFVPTPALALFGFAEGMPCLMVTGSHIPADRNGIKFYRPHGEVLKTDEAGMSAQLVDLPTSAFTPDGMLAEAEGLPPVTDVETAYVQRYVDHFGARALAGKRIGVYQHSAVGRDILARIVRELGAEAVPLGRSETFIPVDTEAIRDEDVILARNWAGEDTLDAIISTDGDSDRPLLADETGSWMRGDVPGPYTHLRAHDTKAKSACCRMPDKNKNMMQRFAMYT